MKVGGLDEVKLHRLLMATHGVLTLYEMPQLASGLDVADEDLAQNR